METEICCYTLESCLNASKAGATRVEICSSPYEGGTTPSAALIKMVRRLPGLEIAVMIRPRGGDFLYSELEFDQMKREIEFARECGADCVVLGILMPDGTVDVARTRELVELAAPMETTFHRAFDTTSDLRRALEDVISVGCTRILTSGGFPSVQEGRENLRMLAAQAAGRIEIMAGCGVNPSNAREIALTGVDALHFSAKVIRQSGMKYRSTVPMYAAGLPEFEIAYADRGVINEVLSVTGNDSLSLK